MKRDSFLILFGAIYLLACGNNTPTTNASSTGHSAVKATKTETPARPAASDDITGTWKLAVDAYDQNDDNVLQDEEREKGISNNYTLQLNPDGSCRLQNVFTGHYTLKTENGNKILTVQRKRIESEEDEDPLPDVYHVKSLTKDELILLVREGGDGVTFWIFKRVG